jgi:cytochrome c-type biogenesis protein
VRDQDLARRTRRLDGVADVVRGRLETIGRVGRALQIVAGIIMIPMGIAMTTSQLSRFAFWLLETFPVLKRIG